MVLTCEMPKMMASKQDENIICAMFSDMHTGIFRNAKCSICSCYLAFFCLSLDFVIYVMNYQRNSTWLILSTGHTITEAMTLEITSVNMQAMIVTIVCMCLSYFSISCPLLHNHGEDIVHNLLISWILNLVLCRYPNKDEQNHFFRHYLRPDKPEEVCELQAYTFASPNVNYWLPLNWFQRWNLMLK